MRWARSKLKWLLLISLIMLLTPSDLALVGAIRSNILWPTPPPPPLLASQIQNESVGQLWVDRDLDMGNLEDVKNQSRYTQLLCNIMSNPHGRNDKKSSNFVDCLSRHEYLACGHRQEARRLLPKYCNDMMKEASKRRWKLGEAEAEADEAHPLAASMKKQAAKAVGAKKKSKDSNASTVAVALSVACIAFVALICLCCCACRGSHDPAYDVRDDRPLLSLNLSDLSGSSRKSCSTPIDVNRLGALPSETKQEQLEMESPLPAAVKMRPRKAPPGGGSCMSMKSEVEQSVMALRLGAHEITTIGGRPTPTPSSSSLDQKAAVSSTDASVPRPPPPPPPPMAPPSAAAPAGPPPPPPPKRGGAGPPPSPPLKRGGAGPPPPAMPGPPKPCGGPPPLKSSANAGRSHAADSSKTKLKPFFWDKVTANPDQAMVWDQIKAGSFQFNEEMIESLFGCQSADKKGGDGGKKDLAAKDASQLVRILDPKKAQNLAISLKALSVSAEDVRSAATQGHDLPSDLIQTLLRWTPTSDEELRLRLYTGEASQLGPAEQFLRTIIDVPHIYQRLDALLFMATLPEEAATAEQSFRTLEVACQELRGSRLFKKLLEAVLKTGNRMNDGTFRGGAQAFKLDTLLKLSDVKGVDGKTTLLHFVVQEIVRSEGVRAMRAAREQPNSSISSVTSSDDLTEDVADDDAEHQKQLGLAVVSSLGDDLQNVRKAACIDSDALTISVASLGHRLVKANEFLSTGIKSLDEDSGFQRRLAQFVEQSQVQVTHLLEEEKKLRSLVRATVDYFHGSTGKDEGLRLFVVVRDFLGILDKVCREVKEKAAAAAARKPAPAAAAAATRSRQPSQSSLSFRDPRQHLVPAIQDRRGAAAAARSSSSSSDSDD